MLESNNISFRLARYDDIEAILALHAKYQIDTIAEQDKADGFITTAFSVEQLQQLIAHEQGLFVALQHGHIVAYVMSASWQYWSAWPIFAYMVEQLATLRYHDIQLSVDNSYQYGPVCVDKPLRGSGVFEQLFAFAKAEMAKRYPVLLTFVNVNNERSYQAHRRKLGLDVLQQFSYNGNRYYEMACLTRPL